MHLLRKLRGALGNALVWGVSWFAASFAGSLALVFTLRAVLGISSPLLPWQSLFAISVNVGATGFLVGAAFSGVLRLAYRNKHLLEIRAGRFALGGAIVAGLLSPALSLLVRVPPDLMAAVGSLLANGALAGVLGGLTAGATIKIAQRASRELTSTATGELQAEQDDVLALLGNETV